MGELKAIPEIAIALNRNLDFKKGVEKAALLIADLNWKLLLDIPRGILSNWDKFSVLRQMVNWARDIYICD